MATPTLTAGQEAANRIKEFRQNVDNGATTAEARATVRSNGPRIQPSVSANEIANPPAPVQPPVPQVNTNDGSRTGNLIGNVATNTQGFIEAQSAEATKAKEIADLLGNQTFDASGERERLGETYGLPDNLARLTDIQTQLAQRNTDSKLTQSRIEGAAGQTLAQAGREVTQEQREAAIRDAGLAAEASVLQGNIETASTLINNAMSDFYADRQMDNQNKINQLNYFSGIADKQTAQLLEKEKRVYEADKAKVERVQAAVDTALASGATTSSEIAMLTNPQTTDNERLALAQLIQARGAKQDRDMDLTIKATQLAKLREPIVATRDTSVVDVNGTKQLVDTQTGEVIATFGGNVSTDEIQNAKEISFVNTIDSLKNHPGMAKAVGTTGVARWTPFKADTMTGQVSDFVGSVENIVKQLTLNTYAEAKERGMTFGAMSESEWDILGNSATKINQWKREREDGSVYYDTSENNMNTELDVLSNFGKMDALRKGIDPASIGVMDLGGGNYATRNSDGTIYEFSVTSSQ